jgi:hypothetical protein
MEHMALAGVDGHIRLHNVWEGELLETLGAYQETVNARNALSYKFRNLCIK